MAVFGGDADVEGGVAVGGELDGQAKVHRAVRVVVRQTEKPEQSRQVTRCVEHTLLEADFGERHLGLDKGCLDVQAAGVRVRRVQI